jgi:hypothetical protein
MLVWIPLAVFVVSVVGGITFAVLRGVALWRQLKRTKGAFGSETERITRAVDEIQDHLDHAGKSNERLATAAERLRVSRAYLDVQLAAVREARGALARPFWFLPGL